jgi:hypothetical protein
VNRQHDGAWSDERTFVVRREERLRAITGERAWQRDLVPPPRARRDQPCEAHAVERLGQRRTGIAVHRAAPAAVGRRAQHLANVTADTGAGSGDELAAIDTQTHHARRRARRIISQPPT